MAATATRDRGMVGKKAATAAPRAPAPARLRLRCLTPRPRRPRYSPDGREGGEGGALTEQEEVFEVAFSMLDRDGDGKLNRAEAHRLLAFVSAISGKRAAAGCPPSAAAAEGLQPPAVAAAAQHPPHWDQHLAQGVRAARASGGVARGLRAFVAGKLSRRTHARPPRASDLLWSAAGMAAAVGALALLAARAPLLPLVGSLHAGGLPLLLGSFGTMCVLLFARPEA
ncbi:hypothetical protein Rsub_09187 [Raphidocelis subcapitata]|uniref:EF-hand domain-containing protein n=1 Tax=Raphidocelis subcapitata TaxID=307507 RepID=A0A2V0P954_9CHLO|nr:hypothetical protein Rsub_09187 [Raphidocelis subcapitata]|eukprot:GBF96388.1 hypothetical protein Rsub_09187 [Raphidocelis subcapitata]